jgi:hypothetical protein
MAAAQMTHHCQLAEDDSFCRRADICEPVGNFSEPITPISLLATLRALLDQETFWRPRRCTPPRREFEIGKVPYRAPDAARLGTIEGLA